MSQTPIVQIALDVVTIESAAQLAEDALAAGADWLELGKPLIDFQGLSNLRTLTQMFPDTYFIADAMIMAGAEKYVSAALTLGVQNITVTALAPVETVKEVITWGKRLDVKVTVDLFNTPDRVKKSVMFEDLGADYLMVHFGVDEKRHWPDGSPLDDLRQVTSRVSVPVSYATYDETESVAAVSAGASIIVQGAPFLTAKNPRSAFEGFITKTKTIGTEGRIQ